MLLQETHSQILIDDGAAQFTCPPAEFVTYEPAYQPVAAPYIMRRWETARQYVSDGANQFGDLFYTPARFDYFISRRAAYQAAYDAAHPPVIPPVTPVIYATLTISGGDGKVPPGIRIGDPAQGSLQLTGDVRLAANDPATILPINISWRITVCQVRSERNPVVVGSFPVDVTLTNGQMTMTDFTVNTAGIYMISDEDFDLIDGAVVGQAGVTFRVELVGGAKFFKAL